MTDAQDRTDTTETPPEQPVGFRIDQGGAVAVVTVGAAADPDALPVEDLLRLAAATGLRTDACLAERLDEIVRSFRADPRDLEEIVAQSVAPVHGDDGRLEWFEGCAPLLACVPEPVDDGTGTVDYYACTSYRCVQRGVGIARLHPPTAGTDGNDVTGRPLPATPGRPCAVRLDEQFTVDDDGLVVAQCSGLLEMRGTDVHVTELFEVDGSVDFSTGHVVFDGSVVVNEDVRDRFIVECTGGLIVKGIVQAAAIQCGSDFACAQGMVGRHAGRLEVHGAAEVGYLNGVRGVVRGDLTVKRELIDCHLVVGGDLLAPQATVMGGETTVGGLARVHALGAKSGRPTTIVLGAAAALVTRLKETRSRARDLRDRLDEERKTRAALAAAIERGGSTAKAERLATLDDEITALEQELRLNESLSFGISRRLSDATAEAARTIDVRGVVHAGVELLVDSYAITFPEPLPGPVQLGWDGHGAPYYRHGSGPKTDLAQAATILRDAA